MMQTVRWLSLYNTSCTQCVSHFPCFPSYSFVTQCGKIQKALFYNVATHFHFDEDEGTENTSEADRGQAPQILPPALEQKCKDLLDQLIAHFTPILFTVATAHHMKCTDVFADTWMPLVISPALGNNGLCKPIETLQTIMDLDWREQGLCVECVQAKREEWKGVQKEVWDKMDEWLGLNRPT